MPFSLGIICLSPLSSPSGVGLLTSFLWSPCQATIYHQFHAIVFLVAELKMAETERKEMQNEQKEYVCFNIKMEADIFLAEMKTIPTKSAHTKDVCCNNTIAMIDLAYLSHSQHAAGSAGISSFSRNKWGP